MMEQFMYIKPLLLIMASALVGCNATTKIGQAPTFTPISHYVNDPRDVMTFAERQQPHNRAVASLWAGQQGEIFGDNRANKIGDILTVVIEIDDKAEISNTTRQSRNGSQSMGVPNLLGLPQSIAPELPTEATMDDIVGLSGSSNHTGNGSVRRNEKLTLRIAGTVTNVMPNGVMYVRGTQEIRVNNELRQLTLQGFVRPSDINRRNEITYDKIASARISYGGRGQITDVQQPRYGQQALDRILPF